MNIIAQAWMLFFTTVSLAYDITLIREPNRCVAYGDCGKNPLKPLATTNMPCLYNEAPQILDQTSFQILKDSCPDLVRDYTREQVPVCCDSYQIKTVAESLQVAAQIYARCPGCWYNYKQIFCSVICGPHQSLYVNNEIYVDNQHPNTLDSNAIGVATQGLYIQELMAEQWYKSCEEVVFGPTNGYAVEVTCNPPAGTECTPYEWLRYPGENIIAPIDLKYRLIGEIGQNTTKYGLGSLTYDQFINEKPEENMLPFGINDPNYVSDTNVTNFVWRDSKSRKIPINTECYSRVPWSESNETCSCTDCKGQDFCTKLKTASDDTTVNYLMIVVYIIFSLMLATILSVYLIKNCCNCHLANRVHIFDKIYVSLYKLIGGSFKFWIEKVVCRFPILVLVLDFGLILGLSLGLPSTEFTTDPIALWIDPNSQNYQELEFYNEKFDPFYRTEMVIVTLKEKYQGPGYDVQLCKGDNNLVHFSEILKTEYLQEFFKLQEAIFEIPHTIDVCLKPLEPDNNACATQSIYQWWQNDFTKFQEKFSRINYNCTNSAADSKFFAWHDHFLACTTNPSSIDDGASRNSCLGEYGGPAFPYVALGGAPYVEGSNTTRAYYDSQALIINLEINNFNSDVDPNKLKLAKDWETNFLNFMENYESEYFKIGYFAERSIEDEIDRAGQADIPLFLAGYLTIFFYLSFALGTYTGYIQNLIYEVRFTLGFVGLCIVASSAFAALGLFGYLHLKSNLIVAEVVPFLLLSIGADNIFIFVLQYKRLEKKLADQNLNLTIEQKIGLVVEDSALSMVMCSIAEAILLFYGGLTVKMPAVVTYSFTAGTAVIFNFFLQMTAFPAVLCLDQKRIQSQRADVVYCLQKEEKYEKISQKKAKNLPLDNFFEKYFYPVIMNAAVRPIILIVFISVTLISIGINFKMFRVGLDQELSVPSVSYVRDFFELEEKYFLVGVPVYFVLAGNLSYENIDIQSKICSRAGCEPGSLVEMISLAADDPDYWKIEVNSQSWIDDFIDWSDPGSIYNLQSKCCNCQPPCNTFDNFKPCMANVDHRNNQLPRTCHRCTMTRSERNFYKYLDWFLQDNPGEVCSKSGHALYSHAIHYVNSEKTQIDASSFMTYQSVCIASEECTENTVRARDLANQINEMLHEKISDLGDDVYLFPYTVFTPYYEMYDTMGKDGVVTIILCFIPVLLVTSIFLGLNLLGGLIMTMTILMIIINTGAICVLWNVQFNPLSIINFITGIGISIEFTGHIVSQYLSDTSNSQSDRIKNTVTTMGSAVLAGVTMTNLPAMIILKFATAKLVEVFFFRMGFTITIMGLIHGLIFLPVLLSYIGPGRNQLLARYKTKKQKVLFSSMK